MDIDIELATLVKKYQIYKDMPMYYNLYKKEYYLQKVNEIIENISADKKIAFRGAGRHTQELFRGMSPSAKDRIAYVIDSNLILEIPGFQVIHPSQMQECGIDVVIISSYRFRTEILMDIGDDMRNVQVIDIYDCLSSEGLEYTQDFYLYGSNDNSHVIYTDTGCTYNMFVRETDMELKRFYLRKMVAQCIEIRDFVTAYEMMDLYIANEWSGFADYINFKTELEILWETIRKEFGARTGRDIIINWIDNINAEEFYSTDFVQNCAGRMLQFSNAYTMSPRTHFTQITLLTGKKTIDDSIYKIRHIDTDNSEVLCNLQRQGYRFKYIANPGMYHDMFDKECLADFPSGFDKVIMNDRAASECSTRLQWYSVKDRLLNDSKTCHLIHNLAETHSPHIYTKQTCFYGDRRHYRISGMMFISKQLEWYEQFSGANNIKIYLADHGDGIEYLRAYEKGRTNIPFIIMGNEICNGIEKRLYSHEKFGLLMKHILDQDSYDKWDDIFTEFVEYQNLDFYNKQFIMESAFRWMRPNGRMDMAFYQVRGIRTSEDMYIKYAGGKELYYRLPDESTNLINEAEWASRIEKLKQMCPSNFVDISKETMFNESYRLYDYLNMMQSGKEEPIW